MHHNLDLLCNIAQYSATPRYVVLGMFLSVTACFHIKDMGKSYGITENIILNVSETFWLIGLLLPFDMNI